MKFLETKEIVLTETQKAGIGCLFMWLFCLPLALYGWVSVFFGIIMAIKDIWTFGDFTKDLGYDVLIFVTGVLLIVCIKALGHFAQMIIDEA